jgi:hypothetical protein
MAQKESALSNNQHQILELHDGFHAFIKGHHQVSSRVVVHSMHGFNSMGLLESSSLYQGWIQASDMTIALWQSMNRPRLDLGRSGWDQRDKSCHCSSLGMPFKYNLCGLSTLNLIGMCCQGRSVLERWMPVFSMFALCERNDAMDLDETSPKAGHRLITRELT